MKNLKSILMALLMLAISSPLLAGGLEFNQVLNLKGDCSSCPVDYTVPAGKVWKLTSWVANDISLQVSPNGSAWWSLAQYQDAWLTSGSNYDRNSFSPAPFWLGEGETLRATGSNSSDYYYISIIEFDVTP